MTLLLGRGYFTPQKSNFKIIEKLVERRYLFARVRVTAVRTLVRRLQCHCRQVAISFPVFYVRQYFMSFTLILYFHKYIFRPISIRTALTLEIKMALMVDGCIRAAPTTVNKMKIFIIGTHNPVILNN